MTGFLLGLLPGLLLGLCTSVTVAAWMTRQYHQRKFKALQSLLDGLVMPITVGDWKGAQKAYMDFERLLMGDSRGFFNVPKEFEDQPKQPGDPW